MRSKMCKRVTVIPDDVAPETDGSRSLTWLNALLKTRFQTVRDIASGACHCQLMDCIAPGSVDLSLVKWDVRDDDDCRHNFGLLQRAFANNRIAKTIRLDELIRGDFDVNLDLLVWFKAFHSANEVDQDYDAPGARDHRDIQPYPPPEPSTNGGERAEPTTEGGDEACGENGVSSNGSLPASTENDDGDKTTSPLGKKDADEDELRVRCLKPCHVALTKLKDFNLRGLSVGDEDGDDGSDEKEEKTIPSHKSPRGRKKANYQDGEGFMSGELVWGGVKDFPWWPGLIIPWKTKYSAPGFRRVEWFGDGTLSKISTDCLLPFGNFVENFCQSSFNSLPDYKRAIYQIIEHASERCEKSFQEAKGDKEKEMKLMLDWASNGFLPSGPSGFATPAAVDVDSDSAQSDYRPPVKKKSTPKNRPSTNNYIFTRDILIERLKDRNTKIEDCCLACGVCEVDIQHPLFEGGLCVKCKDNVTETLYRFDEDGYQSYCTVCCGGSQLILCANASCCRCFCKECLEILVGKGTFTMVKDLDPWSCYICQPDQCRGRLRLRPDWTAKIQNFFANSSAMHFEPHRIYPLVLPDKRRPIRVLSLFDGIATGYLVLKNLGFKVERYIASEICQDSIAVGMVKHAGEIEYVNDVRSITRKHLAQWGPFDLLIGGSPCNDLSIVNPLRKGLFEGTGRLFFEYYRILSMLKPKDGDDRPFFWLFENVVFMTVRDKEDICRFLECNPIIMDAVRVSPAHRARYFWGNVPGMTRPPTKSEDQKVSLQDCLEVGRKAKLEKVRTITTKSNSLVQTKVGLPVTMNGKEDYLWCTELEQIFGFPKHYTDVNNMGRTQRQKVLGRFWSVPVIRHLLAPLKDYFQCEPQ
ncbi:DNA (cytosine-5)-methyltransferase 3C-like isoform X2 [Stigmatopora argus]